MSQENPTGSSSSPSRREERQLRHDARALLKESKRIMRKYRYRIPEEIRSKLEKEQEALDAAFSRDSDFESLREAFIKFDALADQHLAFGRKSAVREYAESIALAVLVALFLRAFVVEAFKIPSGSMIPTLAVGDHIFVNKFIHGFQIPFTEIKFFQFTKPKRGEIIVFKYPQDKEKDFIKRVVAIEGDVVSFENNQISINGRPLPRRQLAGPCTYPETEEGNDHFELRECTAFEEQNDEHTYQVIQTTDAVTRTFRTITVPPDHVFVMGDNRDNSHDSRFWGPVPLNYIKGEALIIWWSSGIPDGIRWKRFFHLVHSPAL